MTDRNITNFVMLFLGSKHPGFALQVVVDLSQFAAGLTASGRDAITEEIQ
jgi:hypothetical protein